MKKEDIKKLFNIDTKEKYNLEKNNAIALFVIFLLVVIVAINDIIALFIPYVASRLIQAIFSLLIIAGVIYYGVAGYKTPHGNLMRYLYLLYAFANAFITALLNNEDKVSIICNLIVIILAAYMSGRLNKYKENTYIIVIGLVALFVRVTYFVATNEFILSRTIGVATSFVLWAALSASYLARFHYHRAAGFEDKI